MRFQFFRYKKQIDELGYLFAIRFKRFGKSDSVRKTYGSGVDLGIVLFDVHYCLEIRLTAPERETLTKRGSQT